MINGLQYAISVTSECIKTVLNLPFFWIDNFTFGDALLSVFVIYLVICFVIGILK